MTKEEFIKNKKEIYDKWKIKYNRLNKIKVSLVKRESLKDSEIFIFNNEIEEYKILLIETTNLSKELDELCRLWGEK